MAIMIAIQNHIFNLEQNPRRKIALSIWFTIWNRYEAGVSIACNHATFQWVTNWKYEWITNCLYQQVTNSTYFNSDGAQDPLGPSRMAAPHVLKWLIDINDATHIRYIPHSHRATWAEAWGTSSLTALSLIDSDVACSVRSRTVRDILSNELYIPKIHELYTFG